MTTRIVTTLTGPSASGKTELVKVLTKNYDFEKLVSVTTRQMRPGEEEGVDYYFVSEEQFKKYQDNNELLQEVNFNGKNYGTTVSEMERVFASGKTPVVIVEPGGVTQFESLEKKYDFKVYSVFVHASLNVLQDRFFARLGLTVDSPLSEYDTKRLLAINNEYETWYPIREWDLLVNNSSSNLETLDWMCKMLFSDISDKVSDQEKVNDSQS